MAAAADNEQLKETIRQALAYQAQDSHHLEELQGLVAALMEDVAILEKSSKGENDKSLLADISKQIRDARTLKRNLDQLTYPLIRIRNDIEMQLRKEEIEVKRALAAAPVAAVAERKSTASGIKMPSLKIPMFAGEVEHYRGFREIFLDMLKEEGEDFSEVKKWLLLRDHLTGRALELVEDLPPAPETYKAALAMLDETYGSVNKAVTQLYQRLQELPKADSTINGLRLTNSKVEGILRSLELLQEDVGANRFLRTVTIGKFPNEIQNQLKVTDAMDLSKFRKKLGEYIRNNENSIESTVLAVPSGAASSGSGAQRNKHRQRSSNEKGGASTADQEKRDSSATNGSAKPPPKKPSTRPMKCRFCEGAHYTDECDTYRTLEQRTSRASNLCVRCLNRKHEGECRRSSVKCAHCTKLDHNRALCPQKFGAAAPSMHIKGTTFVGGVPVLQEPQDSDFLTFMAKGAASPQSNESTELRVLIDTASKVTLVTRELANRLGLKEIDHRSVQLTGALSVQLTKSPRPTCLIYLFPPNYRALELTAVIVDRITDNVRGASVSEFKERYPQFDQLTMPSEGNGREVDLLVGHRALLPILTLHNSIYVDSSTQLLSTRFGWVILGGCEQPPVDEEEEVATLFLQSYDPVKLMCDLDVVGLKEIERGRDEEEAMALEKFYKTLRMINNRYQVAIPYRYDPPDLNDNFGLAWGRLQSLYKKLSSNPELLATYDQQIKAHLAEGVIEPVNEAKRKEGLVHYIPHQAVLRVEKSTPVRVVFDASSKTGKNRSLNDNVLKGTNWVDDLPALLLRFRLDDVAITADVQKAFHQLLIREEDRDVCRFLWLKDPLRPPTVENLQIYRFCRVAFGIASSPFLLNATIDYHLRQHPHRFTEKLRRDFYADNLVTSIDGATDTKEFYHLAKSSFDSMSMNLTKWVSNSCELMSQIPANDRSDEIKQTVLGIRWDTKEDKLSLNVQQNVFNKHVTLTKRQTLKQAATIYDPLGWAMPVVLMARIFIRKLWDSDHQWDQPIEEKLVEEWQLIKQSLRNVSQIELPRQMFKAANNDPAKWEIHAFSDASKDAYATVIYLKSGSDIRFVAAKARLRPKTKLSTPRLELLGAVAAARFSHYIKTALKTENEIPVTLWCDAKCVLAWLHTNKILPSYVQRLVREIRSHGMKAYRYVPSKENPADVASRGATLETLQQMKWWDGPSWLADEKNWPNQDLLTDAEALAEALKLEEEEMVLLTRINVQLTPIDPRQVEDPPFGIDLRNFSSFEALLKRSAFVLCGINRIFESRIKRKAYPIEKETTDYKFVRTVWLKWDQKRAYKDIELKVKSNASFLRNLKLFRDEDGLIRCVTRLESSKQAAETIYPILLVKNSPLTKLLVLSIHVNNMHAGTSYTLARLRQTYWLPSGRQQVYKIIKDHCLVCRRHIAQPFAAPEMAPLPPYRISEKEAPFTHIGMDVFGPYRVHPNADPTRLEKRWVAIFTCLVVRAVHLEVLVNMEALEFMHAFRKFVARRGTPATVVCDNAKQFYMIKRKLVSYWHHLAADRQIVNYFAKKEIKWEFIPEKAPWMGGVYERLIKTAKDAFEKAHATSKLTEQDFQTIIVEIEAILNARPIAYVDKSIDTPLITPNHFLTVQYPAIPLDLSEVQPKDEIGQLWKAAENYLNVYWERWSEQYLLALQERGHRMKRPHLAEQRTPALGDVVLMVNPTVRRSSWRKAIIQKLLTSHDGEVRAAQIKLANKGTMIRPITKLLPLDLLVDLPDAERMKRNAEGTALVFPPLESASDGDDSATGR